MGLMRKTNLGRGLIHAWFILFSIFCIIPLLYVISISFSTESDIAKEGYRLIPRTFTTFAYDYLLHSPKQLINGYTVSIAVTLIGTALSLLITAMLAYTMSRKDFFGANKLSFFIFFTLLFNGGLVPWYILIKEYLHIDDTLLSLILPYVIIPWHVLLMKGFLSEIPLALIESAKIDGAKEWRIFYQIVLPIAKPAMATVGLFIAFIYWNDWWLAMLYIDNEKLIPLQYMLYRIMNNIQYLSSNLKAGNISVNMTQFPNETARMAIAILAAGPILFVFPFFQKYFVKGLTVGAVKG
ncbi:sugar ABC transporter permease [Paenibacillus baekrokdamisoli]|uniref:Sugar ABC transporter permease n=1 Tax=Paenibacillus baekrokdamisoli TaxID=1712516 RepID=A0A3G9IKR4_9BACL|nr:carbohydrate ABC transporter permease [Paenibacillus baekrokdamisoli]MBB3067322.1 putative aldouronate transport system permease protein [Paenibacillus baekrokdamisoli]BBH19490.1 sugar ABC transporter permease [Paenibacillus baekrokdamisoli]